MNKVAIATYLGITFGLGYGIELCLYYAGMLPKAGNYGTRTLLLFAALMYVPGFAALIASAISGDKEHPRLKLFPIAKNALLVILIGVPVAFSLPYILGSMIGLAELDWALNAMRRDIPSISGSGPNKNPSSFIVATGLLAVVVIGATAGAVVSLGSETGWRGYLLQKLLPLGRTTASLLTGLLQGLWFIPVACLGFLGSDAPAWVPIAGLMLTCVAFGLVLGEIHRVTGSLSLTSIACGVYICQIGLIWESLFPSADRFLLAPFGILSSIVWILVAVILSFVPPIRSGEVSAGS
jgi:hypothetical protein